MRLSGGLKSSQRTIKSSYGRFSHKPWKHFSKKAETKALVRRKIGLKTLIQGLQATNEEPIQPVLRDELHDR